VSGNTILSGDGVPSMTLGNPGDFYLELDSLALYGPKTAAGWGSQVKLQGAAGTNGQTGAQGPGAIVDTFSVKTTDWATGGTVYAELDNSSGYGYNAQTFTITNASITAGILDSGMVLAYFTPDAPFNPNQWLPLPYMIPIYINSGVITMDYNYSYLTALNTVTIQFYLTGLSTNNNTLPSVSTISIPSAKYKIVVIPGTLTREIVSAVNKKISKTGHIANN
jgi:hypothetical protein